MAASSTLMPKLLAVAELMRDMINNRACGCRPVCQCERLPDIMRDNCIDALAALEADE